jgi:type VI secretion system lysozyme-like protein
MAVNRTLLERIRNPGPRDERQMHVSTSDVFESILRNMQSLLNTTQGNSRLDDDYGLPHLSTVRSAMPISIGKYEASIRRTIERNEPRLKQVRVRHVADEGQLGLRFEISGMIEEEDGRRAVRFETVADDTGRIRVR